GRTLVIAADTLIENAIAGDGSDLLIGNSADNSLWGMRGNDTFHGGAGNDTLFGGAGTDTAVYAGRRSDYLITQDPDGTITIRDRLTGRDGGDSLHGSEILEFLDGSVELISVDVADQTVAEDTPWSFQLPAGIYPEDRGEIHYTAMLTDGSSLPRWITFDEVHRGFSGTPPPNFTGLLSLTVVAAGTNFIGLSTFTVAVSANNHAPVAVTVGNNASVAEDMVMTGRVPPGFDEDSDHLTYELVAPVVGLTFNADGSFHYMPRENFNGTSTFRYCVVDASGAKSEPQTFTLTVTPLNDAPAGLGLAGGAVAEGAAPGTVVGSLSARDVDGDAFSFSLLDDAGGRFALSGKQLVVTNGSRLDYEQAGSHQITVRASDSYGASADKVLTLTVLDIWNEIITGTSGRDVVAGGSGRDKLSGSAGNDALNAGAGKDVLDGGSGNDRLTGGAGQDWLTGGLGKDVFIFSSKDTSPSKKNADYITDFSGKHGDRIDLKTIDADATKKGDQAFTFTGIQTFTKAGQVQYEKTKLATYIYLNTDNDKTAEGIIKLKGAIDVQKGWFVL
ncbi:Ig-like domain-containing protein, partial [Microvirga aerilata]